MKNWKRVLAAVVAGAMGVFWITGCGDGQAAGREGSGSQQQMQASGAAASDNPLRPETLDTIKVVLFGEESPRMAELMENEFQQIFINEINTKVELMYIPWTENKVGGKVDLMIASGQDFDAAIVDPSWAANSVSKGYLQDLTEVIDKYMPDWKQNMDQTALEAYRYDGKVYGIPIGNKPTGGVFGTVCVRQDIMDKIGMKDMQTFEDLNTYAEKAKESNQLYATYDLASSEYIIRGAGSRNLTPLDKTNMLWVDQDTRKLVDFASSEEFEKAVRLYNDWYQKGLIPKDMLTNTVTLPFQAGMTSFFRGTCGTTVIENEPSLKAIIPDAYTKEYYLNADKPIYKKTYESTAFQVPVSSKKADRVAMFINLLQKNTELADTFVYGIEGVDYEKVNGKIHRINTDELFYQWMIFNVNISSFDESFPDDFIEVYKRWDDEAIKSCSFGFTPDYTPVKTQKAQIDSVWEELAKPMLAGYKGYDENIGELKEELKAAGWDEYFAEMQRQFDAFLAAQGN